MFFCGKDLEFFPFCNYRMEKTQKNSKTYHCELCDFDTSNSTGYARHLSTRKHKKTCTPNAEVINNFVVDKELVMLLIKENSELKQMMMEEHKSTKQMMLEVIKNVTQK